MYKEFAYFNGERSSLFKSRKYKGSQISVDSYTTYDLNNGVLIVNSSKNNSAMFGDCFYLLFGEAILDDRFIDSESFFLDLEEPYETLKNEGRGAFSIIKYNKNELKFTNDSLSLSPVYIFDDNEVFAVTNSPMLLEDILKKELGIEMSRSPELAAYDIAIGTGAFNVTGWENLKLIDFDSEIIVSNTGEVAVLKKNNEQDYIKPVESYERLLEKAKMDLINNVSAISKSSRTKKIVDLTGGMDSRLIFSVISSMGIKNDFYYYTDGEHPYPDANVALHIMEGYGLKRIKFENTVRTNIANNVLGEFSRFLYQSSGSSFMYGRVRNSTYERTDILAVGGGLAGGFKSTYSRRIAADDEDVKAAASNMIINKDIISNKFYSEIEDSFVNYFSYMLNQGVSIKKAADWFYVLSRSRYLIGIGEETMHPVRPKVHALYSVNLIKAAMRLSEDERDSGKIHFDLIKKFDDNLLYIPFAEKKWNESLFSSDELKSSIEKVVPINSRSPKIYGSLNCVLLDFQEKILFAKQSASYRKNNVWAKSQKLKGRNWMWQNLDVIHPVFATYCKRMPNKVEDYFDIDILSALAGRDIVKVNRSHEVRALVFFLTLFLFLDKKEDENLVLI